jgi:hypothetical protein
MMMCELQNHGNAISYAQVLFLTLAITVLVFSLLVVPLTIVVHRHLNVENQTFSLACCVTVINPQPMDLLHLAMVLVAVRLLLAD